MDVHALDSRDMFWAVWACHDAAREVRRTLDTLGNYASPQSRADMEAEIREHVAREARFQAAAKAMRARELTHG